jgi:SAM-dependent methyltransferase
MSDLVVDPSNQDSATAWNATEGEYWAEQDARFEASGAPFRAALLAAAVINVDARVLDIGCGAGPTTRDAARIAQQGSALGVDIAAPLVERARQRTAEAGITNAEFVLADAQIHPFPRASFDNVISQFGTMFFGDPVAAFTNIGRAVRPGGSITLLVWGAPQDNEWFLQIGAALAAGRDDPVPPPGAPGPFSLADLDRTRTVLTSAGFDDVTFTEHRSSTNYCKNADDACAFISGMGCVKFRLQDLDDERRAGALDDLRATLSSYETSDGVQMATATWIVRAARA